MHYLAVLLTVHNRKEKTLECLRLLFDQQQLKALQVDVFLTNDGCTDGTLEAVLQLYPSVHIVQGDGNLFWNRGMHKAWEAASITKDYDFYLWLNDDTLLTSEALSVLLEQAANFSDRAIIVGTTCETNDRELITYGGWNAMHQRVKPIKELKHCDYFNGNIVLIPKYVYQQVGMNDPFFRHALGDFDYGLRAAKMGIQSYVAPGILGWCDAHESLAVWCNPDKRLKERWKAFRTPLGQNPEEFFVFEKRHNGLLLACFHYFTNYLRLICPSLWKNR